MLSKDHASLPIPASSQSCPDSFQALLANEWHLSEWGLFETSFSSLSMRHELSLSCVRLADWVDRLCTLSSLMTFQVIRPSSAGLSTRSTRSTGTEEDSSSVRSAIVIHPVEKTKKTFMRILHKFFYGYEKILHVLGYFTLFVQ